MNLLHSKLLQDGQGCATYHSAFRVMRCAMQAASAWTCRFAKTLGKGVTRADLHISISRNGELFLTSRQDDMIRMLVPDDGGAGKSARRPRPSRFRSTARSGRPDSLEPLHYRSARRATPC